MPAFPTQPQAKSSPGVKDLKKRLIDHGLTVTALARQVGCSRPAASRAIHGRANPRLRTRILKHLSL